MELYCEALAQMDPWTVCCLLLTDGICAGGGVGMGGRAQAGEAMVSILYIPVLIPEERDVREGIWYNPSGKDHHPTDPRGYLTDTSLPETW